MLLSDARAQPTQSDTAFSVGEGKIYDPSVGEDAARYIHGYTANDNCSERAIVYQDTVTGTYGGPGESPFVQRFDNKYYLFLSLREVYARTVALVSEHPFHREVANKVLTYHAHASEVVQDTPEADLIADGGQEDCT